METQKDLADQNAESLANPSECGHVNRRLEWVCLNCVASLIRSYIIENKDLKELRALGDQSFNDLTDRFIELSEKVKEQETALNGWFGVWNSQRAKLKEQRDLLMAVKSHFRGTCICHTGEWCGAERKVDQALNGLEAVKQP